MSITLILYFRSIKRKIVSYNMKLFNILWLRRKDSNLQPLGYEPSELPSAPPRDVNKYKYGGGKGIRTPAPVTRPPGFQDQSLQPDLGIPPFLQAQFDYSINYFQLSINFWKKLIYFITFYYKYIISVKNRHIFTYYSYKK